MVLRSALLTLFLVGAAAASNPTSAPVTGQNVTRVQWGPGGTWTFAMSGDKAWVDLDQNLKPRAQFREANRDAWSVYLLGTDARAMSVQLDLFRKEVSTAATPTGPRTSAGAIARAEARQVMTQSFERVYPDGTPPYPGVVPVDLAAGGTDGFHSVYLCLAPPAGQSPMGSLPFLAQWRDAAPPLLDNMTGHALRSRWGLVVASKRFANVAVDPQGQPWYRDAHGGVSFFPRGGSEQPYVGLRAFDVAVAGNGIVWVAEAGGGVSRMNLGGAAARVNGAAAHRIAAHPNGDAWIVDSRGVVQTVNAATGTLVAVAGAPSALDVGVGPEGSVFLVGRDHHLYFRVGSTFVPFEASRRYAAVTVDGWGDPWVLTTGGEVFRCVRWAFPPRTPPPKAPRPAPRTIDGRNLAWVGLRAGGQVRGRYVQTEAGRWKFTDASNRDLARFVEVNREADAIDLDELVAGIAPGVRTSPDKTLDGQVTGMAGRTVRLDMRNRKILSRPALALEWVEDGDAVDARTVCGFTLSGVEVGSSGNVEGAFTQVGPDLWHWTGGPADPLQGTFRVRNRDEWSVFLQAPGGTTTVQLDLFQRRATLRSVNNLVRTWDVLSSSAVTPGSCGVVVTGTTLQGRTQRTRLAYVEVDARTWREVRTLPPPYAAPGSPPPPADPTTTDLLLVRRDAHSIYLVDRFRNLQGVHRTIRLDLDRGTVHWAPGAVMPGHVADIDYTQALSPEQRDRTPPPVARSRGPGFQVINRTEWPVQISLDQAGCLYYGVIEPGQVFQRVTGAVWFTIRADIVPDGKCHITDWSCAKPVVEMVANILFTAATGGYGAFSAAALQGVAGAALAKAAVKTALLEGARAAATEGIVAGLRVGQEAAMEGMDPGLVSVVQGATSFVIGQGSSALGNRLVLPELPLDGDAARNLDLFKKAKKVKTVVAVGPAVIATVGERNSAKTEHQRELEEIFADSSDAVYGQYAGPAWPFRRPMPQYVVSGGPDRLHRTIEGEGGEPILQETLVKGDPLRITLLLR